MLHGAPLRKGLVLWSSSLLVLVRQHAQWRKVWIIFCSVAWYPLLLLTVGIARSPPKEGSGVVEQLPPHKTTCTVAKGMDCICSKIASVSGRLFLLGKYGLVYIHTAGFLGHINYMRSKFHDKIP